MQNFESLEDFIKILEKENQIKYIDDPISPFIEISKLIDIESKKEGGGKALLFRNVEGSKFPLCANIFGSDKRIKIALGVKKLDDLGNKIRKYLEIDAPQSFSESLSLLGKILKAKKFFPKIIKSKKTPPCQEQVFLKEQINLFDLPILKCWPQDAGRFITMPLVFTKSLTGGKRNLGMYRMQVLSENSTGMHWHIHKDGAHFFNEYKDKNKIMPVAVAIGCDPATIYSATAPMPRNIDELILSGFIRSKPVELVQCLTIDMQVPKNADFVLEGYVDPIEDFVLEGPFGDHTGYYSLEDYYPIFHITAITCKKNPIYNATLVGKPPMEDCYLAKATERLFLPLLQMIFPEIIDYFLPWEGVFHNIVIVSIKKEYPAHGQKIINGLWGQGQMSFCKAICVVDDDINPADYNQIFEKIVNTLDIQKDITITKGILDVLDHSSSNPNFGNKIGIDLTRKFETEEKRSVFTYREKSTDLKSILDENINFLKFREIIKKNKILILSIKKEKSGNEIGHEILKNQNLGFFNMFILYDDKVDIFDNSLILWKLFNNVDPVRDFIFNDDKSRIVIDACKKYEFDGYKRKWPPELEF